ncbi:MAG: hydrolase [Bacteroidota bacterium]
MFIEKLESPAKESNVCCALFHSEQWDNVRHSWSEKPFLKDSVPEIFHVPLPGSYPKAIARMWKRAKEAGAAPGPHDFLLLAHDPSAFKAELYMAVTKDIEGADSVKITGDFLSKVYEGSYGDVPKCLRKTDEFLAANSMVSKKYYIYFPYCPECAKKYGHNYIVVLAEVEPL